MRQNTLGAAMLTLVLLGGPAPLAAQTAGGAGPSSSGQGSAQEKFNLNRSQEQGMMRALRNEQTQNAPSGFDGRVGSKVPDSMSSQPLSNEATAQAPETKGYFFIKLPDRVLLIDPDNKAVVEIVTDETTGSGTGNTDKDGQTGGSPGGSGGANR